METPLPVNDANACESCQQLRDTYNKAGKNYEFLPETIECASKELSGFKKEHAFYSDLKKKIALTDALIRRYSNKCQAQFDLQQKKVEELTHKLASSKRDCILLEEQLAKTLKEIIPWKREKVKFMEEYENNKRKLTVAQDALMANQSGSRQYRIQINEMEKNLATVKQEAAEAKLKLKNLEAILLKRKYNVDEHKVDLAQVKREKRVMAASFEKAKRTVLRLRNLLVEHNVSVPRISKYFLPQGTSNIQLDEDDNSDASMESVGDMPNGDKTQDVITPYNRKIQDILNKKGDASLPSTSQASLAEQKQESNFSSDENVSGSEMMSHFADKIDAQLNLTGSKDDTGKTTLRSPGGTTVKHDKSGSVAPRLQKRRNSIVVDRIKELSSPTRITKVNERQWGRQQAQIVKPVQGISRYKEGSNRGRSLSRKDVDVKDRSIEQLRDDNPPLKQLKEKSTKYDNDLSKNQDEKEASASRTTIRTQSQSGQVGTEKLSESKLKESATKRIEGSLDTTKDKDKVSSPRRKSQVVKRDVKTLPSKARPRIKKVKSSTESEISDEEDRSQQSSLRTRSQSHSGQSGAEKTPINKSKVFVKKRSKAQVYLSDSSNDDSTRPRNKKPAGRNKEGSSTKKDKLNVRKVNLKTSLSDTSDDDGEPIEGDVSITRQRKGGNQKVISSETCNQKMKIIMDQDKKPQSPKIMTRQRRKTDTEIEVKQYPRRSRRLPTQFLNKTNGDQIEFRDIYSDGDKPLDVRLFDTVDAHKKGVKETRRLYDSSKDSGDEQNKSLKQCSSIPTQKQVVESREVDKRRLKEVPLGKDSEKENPTREVLLGKDLENCDLRKVSPLAKDHENKDPSKKEILMKDPGNPMREVPSEKDPENKYPTREVLTKKDPEKGDLMREVPSEKDPENENPTREVLTKKDLEKGDLMRAVPSGKDPENENPTREVLTKKDPEKEHLMREVPSGKDPENENPTREVLTKKDPEKGDLMREVPSGKDPENENPTREVLTKKDPEKGDLMREVPSGKDPENENPTREVLSKKDPEKGDSMREVPSGKDEKNGYSIREIPLSRDFQNEDASREVLLGENSKIGDPMRELPSEKNPEKGASTREVLSGKHSENGDRTRAEPCVKDPESVNLKREVPSRKDPENGDPTRNIPSETGSENRDPTRVVPSGKVSKNGDPMRKELIGKHSDNGNLMKDAQSRKDPKNRHPSIEANEDIFKLATKKKSLSSGAGGVSPRKRLTRSQSLSESNDDNKANQEINQPVKAENLMLTSNDSEFDKKFLKPISPVRSSPRQRCKSSGSEDECVLQDAKHNPFFPKRNTRRTVSQNFSTVFTLPRRNSTSSENSNQDQGRNETSNLFSSRMHTNINRSCNKLTSGVMTRSHSQNSDSDGSDTIMGTKKAHRNLKVPSNSQRQLETTGLDAGKVVPAAFKKLTRSSSNVGCTSKSSAEVCKSSEDTNSMLTRTTQAKSEDSGIKIEEVHFAEPIPTRSFNSRRRTRSTTSTTSSSSDISNQSDFSDQISVQADNKSNGNKQAPRRNRTMSARGHKDRPVRITRSISEPRKKDLAQIKSDFVGQPMVKMKSVSEPVSAKRVTRLHATETNSENHTCQGEKAQNKNSNTMNKKRAKNKMIKEDENRKSIIFKRARTQSRNKDAGGNDDDNRNIVIKPQSVEYEEAHASETGLNIDNRVNIVAASKIREKQPCEVKEQAVNPTVKAESSRANTLPCVPNLAVSLMGRRPSNIPIPAPFQNYSPQGERVLLLGELFEEREPHRHMLPVSPLIEPFQNFDGERSLSPLPISPSETPPLVERPLSALSLPDIPPLPPLVTPLPPSPIRPNMHRSTSISRLASNVRMLSPLVTPPPVPRAISPLPNPPMPDVISPLKDNENTDSVQRHNLIPSPRNFHAVAPRHALAVPPHPMGYSFQAARCLTANFANDERDAAGPSGLNDQNESDDCVPSSDVNNDVIQRMDDIINVVNDSVNDNNNLDEFKQKPVELDEVNNRDNIGITNCVAKCNDVKDVLDIEQSKENEVGIQAGKRKTNADDHEMENVVQKCMEANFVDHQTKCDLIDDQQRKVAQDNDSYGELPAASVSKKASEAHKPETDVLQKLTKLSGIGQGNNNDVVTDISIANAPVKKENSGAQLDNEKAKKKRGRPRKVKQPNKDNTKESPVVDGIKQINITDGGPDPSLLDSGPNPVVTRRRGRMQIQTQSDDAVNSKNVVGAKHRRKRHETKSGLATEGELSEQASEPVYIKLGRSKKEGTENIGVKHVLVKDKITKIDSNDSKKQRLDITEQKSAKSITRKRSQRNNSKGEVSKEVSKHKPSRKEDNKNLSKGSHFIGPKTLPETDHPEEMSSQMSVTSNVPHKVSSKPCSNLLAVSRRTMIVIPASEMRVSGFKRSGSFCKKQVTELHKEKAGSTNQETTTYTSSAATTTSSAATTTSSAVLKTSSVASKTTSAAPTSLVDPATSSVAPATSSVAHTTSSVAPTTSSVGPTTSSVAPATSSVAPATSSVAPTTSSVASSVVPATSSVAPTTSSVAMTSVNVSGSEAQTVPLSVVSFVSPTATNLQSCYAVATTDPNAMIGSAVVLAKEAGDLSDVKTSALSSEHDKNVSIPNAPKPYDRKNTSVQRTAAAVSTPNPTSKIGNLWGDIAKKQTQSEKVMIKEAQELKLALKESNMYHNLRNKGRNTRGHEAAAHNIDNCPASPDMQSKILERERRAQGEFIPLQKSSVASAWGDMASKGEDQQEICRKRRKKPVADKTAAKQQKVTASDIPSTSIPPGKPAPHQPLDNMVHVQQTLDRIAKYENGTYASDLIKRIVSNFQFNSLDLLPVVYARCAAGNTSTQPVVGPIEAMMIAAVMDWTKNNDSTSLVDLLLPNLRRAMDTLKTAKKGYQKKLFALHSTLCRMYTLFCLRTNNLQCARVFAYDIVHNNYPDIEKLVLSIAATWPDVLCEQKSVQTSPVGCVIECVVMRGLQAKMAEDNTIKQTEAALASICGWKTYEANTIANITQQLVGMIEDVNIAHLIDESDLNPTLGQMAFELTKAIELLAHSMRWKWTNDTLIREHLWPVLKKWSVGLHSDNGIKNGSACVVMKIIANVGVHGLCDNKQSVSEVMKMLLAVLQQPSSMIPWCVQLFTADAILQLSAAKPSQSCPILQNWCSNAIQTVPTSLSERIQVLATWLSNEDPRMSERGT